jgi:hypothetical protein
VVGSDRRDAAPVVDAAGREPRELGVAEIGRHLDVHLRSQDQSRHGGGPQDVVERRLGAAGHARARLGAEILHDDFLQVAVPGVHVAQRDERGDALAPGLADADEHAAGERHPLPSGRLDHGEPHARVLVGGAEMRSARLAQPLRYRLQHDALGDADPAQRGDLRFAHDAGVDVRQQAGLGEHQLAHGGEVIDRAGMAELAQRRARGGVAQLGLVTQGEQRLAAAGGAAGPRDRQHLVRAQVGGAGPARRRSEGAVAAHVAAQAGQRNEHLARIADDVAMAGAPELLSGGDELRQRRARVIRQQPIRLGVEHRRSFAGRYRPFVRIHRNQRPDFRAYSARIKSAH